MPANLRLGQWILVLRPIPAQSNLHVIATRSNLDRTVLKRGVVMATHAVKPDVVSIYAPPRGHSNASLMKPIFAAAVTNSTTAPGNQERHAVRMVVVPSSVMLMPQPQSALMTTLAMSAAVV